METATRTPKQQSQANMSDIVCYAMKGGDSINITEQGYRLHRGFMCQCGACVGINYTHEKPLADYEREFLKGLAEIFDIPVFVGEMDLDGGANTEEGIAHCGCLG